MIFQEKKTDKGYTYHLEDIFGVVDIDAEQKLDAGILDDMVVLLLKQNLSAKEISGTVVTPLGEVKYHFVKTPQWSDDEEEICTDTHTSTEKTESVNTATPPFLTKIMSWCKRFVVAFRTAWKSTSTK